MSCNDTITPCPCVPYESTGCLDTYNTDCVKYTGDAISCLSIATGDTLTDIIGHLEDVVCGLSPTAYSSFSYGCLSSQNITSEEQWVEFSASLLCQIIGSQSPGSITSLSTLVTNMNTLTSQVNGATTIATSDAYEAISGLPGPTATTPALLASMQQLLVDHEADISTLQAIGGVVLSAVDSSSIDFTASGTGNHTITGSVKISATGGNSLAVNGDGLYVQVPTIVVVDTPTIDFTASGTLNHTLQAAVKISAVAGNQIIANGDGLYAAAASVSETPITAADTNSIDMISAGTSGHTISANVKIDPAGTNIISVTANGLYADGSAVSVGNNTVTNAKFRDSVGYSVIGKSTTGAGDPADIVANADQVLRRSGSGDLLFGGIVTNNIDNAQVTFAKVQNISTARILGRSTVGSGTVEQLSVGNHINIAGGIVDTYGRTLIGIQTFTSSGTWTKPTGCNAALVYVLGAGGGGGGAEGTASESAAAGGGGAGGHVVSLITSGLGSSETVTVGAGGASGAAGNNAGGAGGTTSFGAHLAASGGSGGSGMASGTTIAVAAGGAAGNATITSGTTLTFGLGDAGGVGMRLAATTAVSGCAGANLFGGGSGAKVVHGAGDGANMYGAGGAGAVCINNNTDLTGGVGAGGIVIVYSYS